jgi:hypothetical protein
MLSLFLGCIVCFVLDEVIPVFSRFIILTLLILLYLCGEILRFRRTSADRWLLNPTVLCSIVTFILPYCIGNTVYLLPEDKAALIGVDSSISPAMMKLMLLVLLAAVAMWAAYWSGIAAKLGCRLKILPMFSRNYYEDYAPKTNAIIFFLLVLILVRGVMIKLGVYGYSSDSTGLDASINFRQYLISIELLSKFILMAVSLNLFSSPSPSKLTKNLWLLVLIFEIIAGLLSGFKSAVVLPLVTAGVCYYYCTNKINTRFVFLTVLLLLVAYSVIEPFRAARYEGKGFTNTSLTSIVNTFITSMTSTVTSDSNISFGTDFSMPLAILSRSSMAYIASLGVEFKDSRELPDSSPAFLKDIFLGPLYAVIPRALWSGKESSRHGKWYLQEVIGSSDTGTSVGMSPFTYLYFAGGGLAVFIGFYFVGMVHRIVAVSLSKTGGVIYLMILTGLVSIDNVFYTFIIDNLRLLLLLAIFFIFIYQRIGFAEINSDER